MIGIIEVEKNIWILEEEGQNVLLKDCLRYGIGKSERKEVFETLVLAAELLVEGRSLNILIERGLVKPLERQSATSKENLWEVRSDGRWARMVFVIRHPRSIVISAVDKGKGSLTEAINRGVKRWKTFIKENARSRLPKRWGWI